MKYAEWYEEICYYKTVLENSAAADEEIAALQAQIDSLMLEYCPEEMTKEQLAEWEKSQKVFNEGG